VARRPGRNARVSSRRGAPAAAGREEAGYAAFMAAAGEPRAYSLAGEELAPEEAAYAAFIRSAGVVAPASLRRPR
jgi:hypothetical protein